MRFEQIFETNVQIEVIFLDKGTLKMIDMNPIQQIYTETGVRLKREELKASLNWLEVFH